MVQKDRLLDFQDISKALNCSGQSHQIGESSPLMENPMTQTGIRLRRYNSKTGKLTSASNSSEDETDDEREHETVLR